MARHVADLVHVTRLWFQQMRDHCPEVAPVPFDEAKYLSTDRLRIGYYEDDGFVEVAPCFCALWHERN